MIFHNSSTPIPQWKKPAENGIPHSTRPYKGRGSGKIPPVELEGFMTEQSEMKPKGPLTEMLTFRGPNHHVGDVRREEVCESDTSIATRGAGFLLLPDSGNSQRSRTGLDGKEQTRFRLRTSTPTNPCKSPALRVHIPRMFERHLDGNKL